MVGGTDCLFDPGVQRRVLVNGAAGENAQHFFNSKGTGNLSGCRAA
jgi:hypothetical protein